MTLSRTEVALRLWAHPGRTFAPFRAKTCSQFHPQSLSFLCLLANKPRYASAIPPAKVDTLLLYRPCFDVARAAPTAVRGRAMPLCSVLIYKAAGLRLREGLSTPRYHLEHNHGQNAEALSGSYIPANSVFRLPSSRYLRDLGKALPNTSTFSSPLPEAQRQQLPNK